MVFYISHRICIATPDRSSVSICCRLASSCVTGCELSIAGIVSVMSDGSKMSNENEFRSVDEYPKRRGDCTAPNSGLRVTSHHSTHPD